MRRMRLRLSMHFMGGWWKNVGILLGRTVGIAAEAGPAEARTFHSGGSMGSRGTGKVRRRALTCVGVAVLAIGASTVRASSSPLPLERPDDTFETLHARFDARAAEDPDALHMLVQAAMLCREYDPKWKSEPYITNSFRVFGTWQDRFCGGVNRGSDYARYKALGGTTPWNAPVEKPLTLDEAVEVALTSDSPTRLESAAYTIENAPQRWEFGANLVRYTATIPNLGQLQGMAVRSIACRYSGACDAGGMDTMWMCARDRLCRPPLTVFGMWAMQHSPVEM